MYRIFIIILLTPLLSYSQNKVKTSNYFDDLTYKEKESLYIRVQKDQEQDHILIILKRCLYM